jgi:cell division protein FtsB
MSMSTTPNTPAWQGIVDHHLSHLETELHRLNDRVEQLGGEKAKEPTWKRWLKYVVQGVVSLGVAGLVLNHYADLRHDRNALQQKVEQLQAQLGNMTTVRAELDDKNQLLQQHDALEGYALMQGKLTPNEIARYVKAPSSLTVGKPSRKVWISYPYERLAAGDGFIVRGGAIVDNGVMDDKGSTIKLVSHTCWKPDCGSTLPSAERTIWIVTRGSNSNRLNPQGNWKDQAGPAIINSSGEWFSPAVFMGSLPAGRPFLISAVLVDRSAEDAFKTFLRKSGETNNYEGFTQEDFPAGAEIVDTVQIVRQ